MSWRRHLAKFRNLFSRPARSADLDDEIRAHLKMEEQENLEDGLSPEEAHYAALRRFGNMALKQEETREMWEWKWLEDLLHDVRYGLRQLWRNPGFTAVAVITLAMGIGANTAIFSVVDSALLHPLPFPQPDRLVDIYASWPQFEKAPLSYPNFLDLQRDNHGFQTVADWRIDWFTLTGSGDPERLAGEMVSADFLSVLGVHPVLGRAFHAEEDVLGGAPVAMLGEGLWKRRFGSDRSIIGKTITLNDRNYTVVGVVPSRVRLLHFQDSYFNDVFVPVGQWENSLLRDRRFSMGLRTVGRLKADVSLQQAQAEMHQLQANLSAAYPNVNAGLNLTVDRLKDDQIGDIQPALLMLWGAVGLVLMIACANVANLLLARAHGRHQELAIRAAVGASRSRIVRQLLVETLLLVAIGGPFGTLLAERSTRSVLAILPTALPATSQVGINWRVMAFAVAISFVAGILFGLIPALRLSSSTLQEKLQESHHRIAGSQSRTQAALVAVEIGLTLVLLSGAGLLIRSLEKVWSLNPGFDPAGILTCKVSFSPGKMSNPAKAIQTMRELTANVAALPGANSVAIALGGLPFEMDSEVPVWPNEKPKPEKPGTWPLAVSYIVGPAYFNTMRIPLIRGRGFTEQDSASAPSVVIVDEDLANSMFPGEDPLGKELDFGASTEPSVIVGVVGHVAQSGFDAQGDNNVRFQVYSPSLQVGDSALPLVNNGTTLVLRAGQSPPTIVEPIRQTVQALDSGAVVYDVRTLHEVISASLANRQFSMTLLGAFAGIALLLAAVGIYGVVSFLVGQRTHEIGIRMALGARPGVILLDVLSQGGKMALAGVALGLVASIALARLIRSMLFGVTVTDPLTYAAVVLVLLAVTALACWIPARRATKVDPMTALRYE